MVVGRVTATDIAAAGSLSDLIVKLLEEARSGQMEGREKAAASLRSLAAHVD